MYHLFFRIAFLIILTNILFAKLLPPKVIHIPNSSKNLSIFIGGDTFLKSSKITGDYDSSSFVEITEILKQSDFVTSNLETDICDKCTKAEVKKDYSYKMKSSSIKILKKNGFNLFYLANNHITDFRHEGMLETIELLKKSGLKWIGAGINEFEARRGFIIQKGRIKVGILNYMEYREEYQLKFSHFSTVNHSGVANFSKENIEADVSNLRTHGAKIVMVHIHWGENYLPITENQRIHAQMMSDAGVDIVVGTHPHIFQGLEKIGKSLVFFSIGNFVFNTPGRYAKFKQIGYAFPVTLHFNENGLRMAEVWPLLVDNKVAFNVAKKLEGNEGEEALKNFKEEMKLEENKMEITNDRGIIIF